MYPVTPEHVERRFKDFVEKYAQALATLQFDADSIANRRAHLTRRLAERDFRRYGTKPVHELHGGKRITRFYIKQAILLCPAQRERIRRWQAEYNAHIAEVRKTQPFCQFFSFEAVYGGKLNPPLAPFRRMFML